MNNYREQLRLYITATELKRAIDWRIISKDLLSMEEQTPLEELSEALRLHDWPYSYSDSASAYHRGEKQADNIRRLVRLCGAEGDALYKASRGGAFKRAVS